MFSPGPPAGLLRRWNGARWVFSYRDVRGGQEILYPHFDCRNFMQRRRNFWRSTPVWFMRR